MPNDDVVRGLIPLNRNMNYAHYYRASTGADIFIGDSVIITAAGLVGVSSAATIGVENLIGVAIGFAGPNKASLATDDPFLDASDLTTLAAGLPAGDRFILVADDPNQEFYVQEDTGGTALTLAEAGAAINIVYRSTTSGNETSGFSRSEIDASAVVTTTAAQLQILRLYDGMNADGTNNAVGDYAKWVVKFVTHQLGGAANAAPVV